MKENMFIRDRMLYFSNCICANGKLWFVSSDEYFMNMDLDTKKVSYAELKNMNSWETHSVIDNMFINQKSIYWVDQFGKNVHEYKIGENECYCYELPEVEMVDWQCYAGTYMYNDMLYLFPRNKLQIIEFDMWKKQYTAYSGFYEELNRKNGNNELLLWCSVKKDKWIYLFQKKGKMAVRYNLYNKQYEYIEIPREISSINYVVLKNNIIYLLSFEGNVYAWDGWDEKCDEIFVCKDKDNFFCRIAITEHKLFLLSTFTKQILIVDLQSRNVTEQKEYPDDLQYTDFGWSNYLGFAEDEKTIWFASRPANYLLCINKDCECIEWVKMVLPTICEHMEFYKKIGSPVMDEKDKKWTFLFGFNGEKRGDKGERRIGKFIWESIHEKR